MARGGRAWTAAGAECGWGDGRRCTLPALPAPPIARPAPALDAGVTGRHPHRERAPLPPSLPDGVAAAPARGGQAARLYPAV